MLAAIPSVIYGFWGVFLLAPCSAAGWHISAAPSGGGKGILLGRARLVDHDRAVHRRHRLRRVPGRAALAARRRRWPWRDALADNLERRAALRPAGHRRRRLPGAGPGAGRDDGRHHAHRQPPDDREPDLVRATAAPSELATRSRAFSTSTMAADTRRCFRSVLVELGLLLLVVTMIINSLARLLHLARCARPAEPLLLAVAAGSRPRKYLPRQHRTPPWTCPSPSSRWLRLQPTLPTTAAVQTRNAAGLTNRR